MSVELEPIALPVSKAAKLIGRSRAYLDQVIRAGEIPVYQPPSRRNSQRRGEKLVCVDDLKAWVKRNAAGTEDAA
jgi:hypothetical protein